jgi:hypothetical protein
MRLIPAAHCREHSVSGSPYDGGLWLSAAVGSHSSIFRAAARYQQWQHHYSARPRCGRSRVAATRRLARQERQRLQQQRTTAAAAAAAVAAAAARYSRDVALNDSRCSSSTGTGTAAGAAAATAKAPLLLCEVCDCVCMGADELLRRLDPTFPHPTLSSTSSSSGSSSSSHCTRTMCYTPLIVLDLRSEGEVARNAAGILRKVRPLLGTQKSVYV